MLKEKFQNCRISAGTLKKLKKREDEKESGEKKKMVHL